MQQGFGQTIRQSEKDYIFDLLAGPAYTPAQYIDQSYRDFRIISNERDEITAFDNHQFAVIDCNSVRRSLTSVKKGDLPEKFAGNNQIENCVFSLFGRRTNSYGAGPDCIKFRANIALVEYDVALFYLGCNDTRSETLNNIAPQILEKWMGTKQLILVEHYGHATRAKQSF
jgi:hypothetical protein